MGAMGAMPPQPPEVTGGKPFSGMAGVLGPKPQGDSKAPAADPAGALKAQGDAVEKVLKQMASMDEKFAPFANRMMDILKAGMGQVGGGEGAGASPMSMKPPGPDDAGTAPA